MLPPPPWLPEAEFKRWMSGLQITNLVIIACLLIGGVAWVLFLLATGR